MKRRQMVAGLGLPALISLGLGLGLGLAGCGDDQLRPVPVDPGPAGCNPLVGDDCLSPFPSSVHEVADPTTRTGFRVALPPGILPASATDVALDPARMNRRDGFSPATPFVIYFAAGVDATQLPAADAAGAAASLTPGAAVQLLDYQRGERVPLFAELDANARPGQRQALIIHPQIRLRPASRYVVALVGLRDAAGQPLHTTGFAALRDGTALSPALRTLAPRYDEIFTALDHAGVARSTLTLAWDVVTASDQTATGHLVAMRDTALGMASSLGYTITSSTDTPTDRYRAREVFATIQVPSFLTSDEGTATMNFGADGEPAVRALTNVPIVLEIPKCARTATAPLPFLFYGHGLFGSAKEALGNPGLQAIGNRMCMILVGTDWIGLAFDDIGNLGNHVVTDLNNIGIVTDRLQQAQVNAQMMARQVRSKLKDDPALALDGRALSDGSEAYYFGISNGGIQGTVFMALSPDVVRGVLNVPGCEWNLMMYRSSDFNRLYPLLNLVYPDPLDRQQLIAASQSEWDYTDPASFAPHLLADPLPGAPAKRILVQESIGDSQVSNLATRILARTMGLTGLNLEQPVFGITEQAAPLDSAYTQWNVHATPLPPTVNMPSEVDNGAHDAISGLPALQEQIAAFLRPDGQVTLTCTGPCVFPR
jgi:hypothetical protein